MLAGGATVTILLLMVAAVVLPLVMIVLLFRGWVEADTGQPIEAARTPDRVARVIDGDTVELTNGYRKETVRLIGIDTPETHHPTKPVGCYGPEAAARTAELLPPGTKVRVERDVEARDTYGRLLAYVIRSDDGLFVNLELAREGYAQVLSIAPNTAHAREFLDAVGEARRERRGLWSACPSPP